MNVSLGPTLYPYTYQENIGSVRNTGLEGTVAVGVLSTPGVTWDVAVNASLNHNRLTSLAPGVVAQSVFGDLAQYRQAVGYPLYGLWPRPVTYADINHDGVLEAGEVTLGDSVTYQGPSLPTQEASLTTRVGLWRGAVILAGLVDYRGGYKSANDVAVYEDYFGASTPGANIPTAPLRLQARAAENVANFGSALDDEDGSFVRVREVSATYVLPRSLVRALRLRNVSVTAAVRNLALWTRYSGGDPEVTNSFGANDQYTPTAGGNVVNNDTREDAGAVPLARYWVLRINAGL